MLFRVTLLQLRSQNLFTQIKHKAPLRCFVIVFFPSCFHSNQLDRDRVWTFGSGPRMCVGDKFIHKILKVCFRLHFQYPVFLPLCSFHGKVSMVSTLSGFEGTKGGRCFPPSPPSLSCMCVCTLFVFTSCL